MWEAFGNPFPLAAACSFSSRHHGAAGKRENGNRTGDNTRGVLVLRALHSGRGSAGEITYRGNVLTKAFLDNHETVLLPNLRFLHLGRLLVGVSATSK